MRNRLGVHLAIALIATSTLAAPATAQSVLFSFDDMSATNVDFTFTLPQSPTPDEVDEDDDLFFEILDVQVTTIIGGNSVMTMQDIQFVTEEDEGGLTTFVPGTSAVINDLIGVQLFTGPVTAPTFRLGSFALLASEEGSLSGSGTLTISQVVASPVPEPATWATMLLGFGAVGYAMRRRRARGAVALAA